MTHVLMLALMLAPGQCRDVATYPGNAIVRITGWEDSKVTLDWRTVGGSVIVRACNTDKELEVEPAGTVEVETR